MCIRDSSSAPAPAAEPLRVQPKRTMPGSNASSDGFDRSPLHAKDGEGGAAENFEEPAQEEGAAGRDQQGSEHGANQAPSQDSGGAPAQPNMGPASSQPHTTAGKLFIGGITGDTQETDLKDYFQSFGALTDVVVMRGFTPCSDCTPALLFSLLTFPDKITGRGRGFGFVTFEDPAVVERILGGKHELKGRTVRLALPELRCVAEFWGFDFERTYR
eukprot:1837662-Rhodomonas_salina.2